MGTKNRERRAAKAKRRAREAGRRSGGGAWHERRTDPPYERLFTRGEQVRGLLELGAAAMERGDDEFVNDAISLLASAEVALVDRESEAALLAIVSLLWTHGWQPAELVRHARRADARFGRLVAVAVAADHAGRDARTLHPAWAAQVESLGLPAVARSTGWLAGFTRAARSWRGDSLVATVIGALRVLYGVGPLPPVLPPPGQTAASPRASADVDDPVLVIGVRALLAQAESTTFDAEAAAFTAKGRQLMARHVIDAVVLWASCGRYERPTTIRLPIDDPYADIKALLLHHVALRSRSRRARPSHVPYGLVSVVGFALGTSPPPSCCSPRCSCSRRWRCRPRAPRRHPVPGPAAGRSARRSWWRPFTRRVDQRLGADQRRSSRATPPTTTTVRCCPCWPPATMLSTTPFRSCSAPSSPALCAAGTTRLDG